MRRSAIICAVALAAAACLDEAPEDDTAREADGDTDGDTDTDTDADADSDADGDVDTDTTISLEVDHVTYGYDRHRWFYEIANIGHADATIIDVYLPDGHSERHSLVNTEVADDGSWDLWAIELPVVTDQAEQQDSVTTAYAPDAETECALTWMVSVSQRGTVMDCAVWGADPDQYASFGCWEIRF